MSYKDWTTEQKQAVKAWIVEQDTRDTVKLRRLILDRPITDYNDYDSERPRDGFTVKVEKELLAIASAYGITKQDTIAGALAKITDDKKELIFRMDYLHLRALDVTGDDNTTINHHDPIYGQSQAEVIRVGAVTGDDIEAAIRA